MDIDPTGKIFDFSNPYSDDSKSKLELYEEVKGYGEEIKTQTFSPVHQNALTISFSQNQNYPVVTLLDQDQSNQNLEEQQSMYFAYNPEEEHQ